MRQKAEAAIWASFAADSLALAVHWIYDTDRIAEAYGRVDTLMNPEKNPFHKSKKRGEFTHYGDQAFVLLESVAAKKSFDLEDFSARWQDLFKDYDGYFDEATKGTLQNYAKGSGPEDAGSPSNDLSGAARIAPLILCYRNDLDGLVNAARAQTQMTHTDPLTVDSAEFFARVAWNVLMGETPLAAIRKVSRDRFSDSRISEWTEQGLASRSGESVPAVTSFGQSCHTPEAFPGVIHLITKYENDLQEALIQSLMAGGDSAGRGMMVGAVLGPFCGKAHLPDPWISGLAKVHEIQRLVTRLG